MSSPQPRVSHLACTLSCRRRRRNLAHRYPLGANLSHRDERIGAHAPSVALNRLDRVDCGLWTDRLCDLAVHDRRDREQGWDPELTAAVSARVASCTHPYIQRLYCSILIY